MKKLFVLAMLGAFSAMIVAPAHACYYTPGYWKKHPWPVTEITLCGTTYTEQAARDLLKTPIGGDITIQLAHQLIAAKLNCAAAGYTLSAYLPNLISDAEAALCAAGGVGGNPEKGSSAWENCDYYIGLLDVANNTPW